VRQEKLKNWACIWVVGGITACVPMVLMETGGALGALLARVEDSGVLAPLSIVLFMILSGVTIATAYVISERRALHSRRRGHQPILRLRR
jgi:hypothetical protein